jgi:hypothetical protein
MRPPPPRLSTLLRLSPGFLRVRLLLGLLKVPPLPSLARSPPIRGGTLSPEDEPLAQSKDGMIVAPLKTTRTDANNRHNVLPLVLSVRGACYTRQAGRKEAEAAFAAALLVPGLVREI